jgi:hypothetical protein
MAEATNVSINLDPADVETDRALVILRAKDMPLSNALSTVLPGTDFGFAFCASARI